MSQRQSEKTVVSPPADPQIEQPQECRTLKERVVDYYCDKLKTSQKAQAYIRRRGIVQADVLEHFKIGFSDRNLVSPFPINR